MDRGLGREFEQEARGLMPQLPAPNAVKISIPKNHPRAQELFELATLLATRQRLASGIEIERPVVDPNADQRILGLLAKMGVNVDEILKNIGSKPQTDQVLKAGLGLLEAAVSIAGVRDQKGALLDLLQANVS